jgi:CspA family cold shock protein
MKKGRIKTFMEEKGFGFIAPDGGGEELFFHKSSVQDMGNSLEAGAPVEYEDGPGRKPGSRQATRVLLKGYAEGGPQPSVPVSSLAAAASNAALAAECFFQSFYEQNQLAQRVFFAAPQQAARVFRGAGLKSTQFRQLYQGFLAFAGPLRDRRMTFAAARERFGVFYCERIVRQVERKVLPPVVKELIDAHREIAFREEREMLALFRYLTNIYCYFGDSEKN